MSKIEGILYFKYNIKFVMPVHTRQFYKIDIDFDAASKAWRENKKKCDNCCFEYICIAKTKRGYPCRNKPCEKSNYCRIHSLNAK